MSHHLDSPLARQDPRLDISDVYVFRGAAATVFIMNVNPLSGAGGFHPEGRYEFRVDTDGDAVEDHIYVLTFGEYDADGGQSLEVRWSGGPDALDREAVGILLARGRTGQEIAGAGGVRVWAGPAADPFFINGAVVGAVKEAVANGTPFDLSAVDYRDPANLFAGTNVSAIVLEIPDEVFGVTKIGLWGTTALATDSGGWRQINRCATPLINTIFNPDDSDRSSEYNTTHPSRDRALYGPIVSDLVTKVVAATGSSDDPAAHARRVVDELFPDILTYQIGTPAEFGFAVRNGRGLTHCAPEVMFALVLNKAVPLGLDSSSATGALRPDFPYLASPM
ncbi:hypothetical protein GCM10027176_37730 [Actinoallomurus bryophytorum]|uniref:Uncharacterized protein DUF4331 n=1 Tax=Actinoallomurus bryophytorum TaxID=1490222 RepID=A0A543CJ12_9ACTN|nr:DUF4331 family protein [Actinoallomurus bryophytorum]TQL97092.1 uncharacterized protein DUF4331 [Actinoallomurus bryophytorum]